MYRYYTNNVNVKRMFHLQYNIASNRRYFVLRAAAPSSAAGGVHGCQAYLRWPAGLILP